MPPPEQIEAMQKQLGRRGVPGIAGGGPAAACPPGLGAPGAGNCPALPGLAADRSCPASVGGFTRSRARRSDRSGRIKRAIADHTALN